MMGLQKNVEAVDALLRGLVECWMMAGTCTVAQIAIQYDATQQVWQITAGEMSYVLGVNDRKALQTIYWGPKLEKGSAFATPKEYPEAASSTTPLEYVGGGLPYEPT